MRARDRSHRPETSRKGNHVCNSKSNHRQIRRTSGRPRTGAAVVEFALVAPIVFILLFGALEFSRMNMIRHTADVAAYEAARRGIVPGAKQADVIERAKSVLAAVGVQLDSEDVQVSPNTINRLTPQVTVTIDVDLDQYTWVPMRFMSGMKLQSKSTLSREIY